MASSARPLTRRPLFWAVVGLFGLVIGVVIGVGLGWRAAMSQSLVSRSCESLPDVDLTVPEIVALKKRWQAYVRSSDPDATVAVTPREATFLLRAESDLGVFLSAAGERLDARITVPANPGCYNVHFAGGVQVNEGLAVLDVDALRIGATDLSGLTGLSGVLAGSKQAVGPDDIADPRLGELLRNVDRLAVRDGELHVRFADPAQVWR